MRVNIKSKALGKGGMGHQFLSGAMGGLACPALAGPLLAGQLNFPSCVITSEPSSQVLQSTIHTRFFFPKTYVWNEKRYAQILPSKIVQFLLIHLHYDEAN